MKVNQVCFSVQSLLIVNMTNTISHFLCRLYFSLLSLYLCNENYFLFTNRTQYFLLYWIKKSSISYDRQQIYYLTFYLEGNLVLECKEWILSNVQQKRIIAVLKVLRLSCYSQFSMSLWVTDQVIYLVK